MNNNIEMFWEPVDILEVLSTSGTEMSKCQLAFLCGLIKENRPKKIVEVGTSAGGTAAVLMNCVYMLGLDTEIFAVDINDRCYREPSKKTGYLTIECSKILENPPRYKRCIGILPEVLGEIGDDIDFLILDTTHRLPGELLDFCACLPKLKEGAVVAVHDIILNQLGHSMDSYATKVLLCAVKGDKIECKEDSTGYLSSNIGAFKVTKDTRKYIKDVFSALTLTWRYMPDEWQIEKYREIYSKCYNSSCLEIFDDAVNMNRKTLERLKLRRGVSLRKTFLFLEELKDKDDIYIYGCGIVGRRLEKLLESFDIDVLGWVISDNEHKKSMGKPVWYISEMADKKCNIVLGMSKYNQKSVCDNDMSSNWIRIEEDVLLFMSDCID